MPEYHFELIKAMNDEGIVHFWWRIKSRNRRILASSETYTTKDSAYKVVRKLKSYIGDRHCTYTFIDETP